MKLRDVYKSIFCFAILSLFCLPWTVSAAQLNFQSDTILRMLERDTTTKDSAAVLPIYEYIQLDIGTPDEPGLSFHLYGWGRLDMADNDYYDDSTAGELLYSYIEYTGEQAAFNARLGRQYLFEGVADTAIDGLRLSSDLGKYFSGSVYAGLPVDYSNENGRDGDSIYGARIANHMTGWYDLGLSYQKISNDSDSDEKAGMDLSAYLPLGINLYGFSSLNLDTDEWAEHSYELRFSAGPVGIRPYFQKFRYEDYFGTDNTSVNPFAFLANSGEELTVVGTEATLPIGNSWTLVANIKNYDYKVLSDSSRYYSGKVIWSGEEGTQLGGEAGLMDGDTDQNKYLLVRVYGYWTQLPAMLPVGYVSSELMYVDYDQAIYGEDSSFFVSVGVGQKFLDDALDVKVSGDYSKDPYYDEDLQAMVTLSYRFGKDL